MDRIFAKFWNAAIGFYTVWIAYLGIKYGIINSISVKEKTIDEISEENKLNKKAVEIWCNTAYTLSLIDIVRNKYRLKENLKEIFADENSIRNIAGLYSYITIRSLDYAAFDSFFKKGKAQKITKNLIEAYSKATNFDHLFFTRSILTKNVEIYDLLLKGCKVLDVGCGSGEWIFKMSNLFPNSTFIGIDKDENSIKIASSKIKSKNVHFYKKDAKNIDYLNEFEIVNLCEVLCVTKNKEKVLSASYRALKKGGYMIIVEGLIEKPKRDLINKILYPMQLDMALQGGSFLSKNELIKLLSKYSLKTEFIDAGGGLWFILCKKY